jgi:hypothetical protein
MDRWRQLIPPDAITKEQVMSMIPRNALAGCLGIALVAALGCSAGVKPTPTGVGGAGGSTVVDAGADRPAVTGVAGSTGAGGSFGVAGTGGPDAACTPTVTCTPEGGTYCGRIGNGCRGQALECGACSGDNTCDMSGGTSGGLCVGGPSCPARTCMSGTTKYCGTIGDGCGRALDCGGCGAGEVCSGRICVAANCTPLTCAIAGGNKYCGMIGDNCGGTLDCGGCSAPFTCGGAGVAGVCGASPANCPNRLSCMPMGGQYCGVVGDNCGSTIDCGTCANGMPCGTGAMAHVCPSSGPGPCTNLQCQLDNGRCASGATTISGRVFDPAGKIPLYNVLVYVPNTALGPIPTGASCDRCDSPISGQPVAAALTDANGRFTMMNAPSGTNIPLVIQIGKWRRKVILPTVTMCRDNAFNDATMMRLPRSMNDRFAGDAAGDVHMPRIALSTGHSDALDCLLRKIGIADSEFTNDSGNGRVHMYVGGADSGSMGADRLMSGAMFAPAYSTLFANYNKMAGYDIMILQCEGSQLESQKEPYLGNMMRYANGGGRIFADHLHSVWIRRGLPPWPATADWIGVGDDLPTPTTGTVDTSFPKGAALADWLVANNASTTRGQLQLVNGQHSVDAVSNYARRWIYTTSPATTQYLTFNTPVETAAANQCGRVVFTDVHVSLAPAGMVGDQSHPGAPGFPAGCMGPSDLTPQEKALEFMFFDLSSCVQIETGTPMTPPIPVPGTAPTPPPIAVPAPAVPPPPPPPPPPLDPDA